MTPNQRTDIIVVRHGETEWNKAHIFQGQLDSPLSELGIKQAEAAAAVLADEKINTIYASDLGRAVHTAKIISAPHGIDVKTDPRLRERNLGVFQGLNKQQMLKRFSTDVDKYRSGDADHVIPEGESSRQRYDRSTQCLQEIAEKNYGDTVLIVTHGGVLRGFLEMVLDLPMTGKRHFSLYNASLARLSLVNDHWMLNSWGETWHLRHLEVKDDF